jgi:hypothetical protein
MEEPVYHLSVPRSWASRHSTEAERRRLEILMTNIAMQREQCGTLTLTKSQPVVVFLLLSITFTSCEAWCLCRRHVAGGGRVRVAILVHAVAFAGLP